MKLHIDTGDLAILTTAAAKALPSRPPVPVLAGLLLTAADNGELSAAAFDYEVSVTTTGTADVGEPGQALVPGRLLADIAKALPKGRQATLHLDGPRLQLTAGTSKFTIPVLPWDEYPSLPPAPPTLGTIDGDLLSIAVAQVYAAVGRDDTLPTLTGVYLEVDTEQQRVTLTATDRYRFAVRHLPLTLNPDAALPARPQAKEDAEPRLPAVLVPGRALADATRLLSGGTVQLAADGKLFALADDSTRTTSRLLEGDFPRWHALFPSPQDLTCTVQADRTAWSDTLKRVALVLQRNSPVRLQLDAAGQRLVFHAGTGDDAQAVDEIPAAITGDADLEVAFNPGYLADALASFDADTIRASFTTSTRPVLFTTAADAGTDADHLHLLMPIKLQA